MNILDEYCRTTRSLRCPVCGKPDWCLIAKDGTAAICQRVESGCACGEAGWKHNLDEPVPIPSSIRTVSESERRSPTDFAAMSDWFHANRNHEWGYELRRGNNLDGSDTYPMRDWDGAIVGIRIRKQDGAKLAVTGSRQGLFIPYPMPDDGPVFVPEGPTDTMALVELGLAAIGRPSCLGGFAMLEKWFRANDRPAVVVADNDEPGIKAAIQLGHILSAICETRIITPPPGRKDIREAIERGTTASDIMSRVEWSLPVVAP